MSNSRRLRIGIAVFAAAAAYYYALLFAVGYLSTIPRPAWWAAVFPSRLVGARMWLVTLHTVAVLLAAVPAALLVRILAPSHRVTIAVVAAVMALVAANLPIQLDLLSLSWSQHPAYFITDALKVLLALPILAWLFALTPSNSSLQRDGER